MERLKQRLVLGQALDRRRMLADPFAATPETRRARSTAELMAEVIDAFRTMGQQHAARRRFGSARVALLKPAATPETAAAKAAESDKEGMSSATASAGGSRQQQGQAGKDKDVQYLQDVKEVCLCVRACVSARACVCVCVCMNGRVHVTMCVRL
jgi:hypothetical protein